MKRWLPTCASSDRKMIRASEEARMRQGKAQPFFNTLRKRLAFGCPFYLVCVISALARRLGSLVRVSFAYLH